MSDRAVTATSRGCDVTRFEDVVDLSILGAIRVVDRGHIHCYRCGFDIQWSGGAEVADERFGSESLGAYLFNAQHPCNPTERPEQPGRDVDPPVKRRRAFFGLGRPQAER